jgi:hypothetical protein
MNSKQLSILNSLVTYAAEHIPGGLNGEEREVAQIVGLWALNPLTFRKAEKTHVYKIINSTASHHTSPEAVANSWAERGWRVVAVVSDTRPGYAHSFVLERPVGITHPDD